MFKIAIFGCILGLLYLYMVKEPSYEKGNLEHEYDYIIVGSGSAGAVIASRLSEDASTKVALLEAGPGTDEFPHADIPALILPNILNDHNWKILSTQKSKLPDGTFEEKVEYMLAGRVLGGTSVVNFMNSVRGSPHDFDHWEALGNKGWSYKDVLPYFKKLEKVTDPMLWKSDYRGKDGPITITKTTQVGHISKTIMEVARSKRIKVLDDYNGADNIGISEGQMNIKRGVRQSTTNTYLKVAMARENLHVLTWAYVTKIIFEDKKAIGVQYLHDGRMKVVKARQEIVLSAGNAGSAKLLMLSGIGPKDHLLDFQIPIIADLPVGRNIKDHVACDGLAFSHPPRSFGGTDVSYIDIVQYKLFGTGKLSMDETMVQFFHRSKLQPNETKFPYLQFLPMPVLMNANPQFAESFRAFFNLPHEEFTASHPDEKGKEGYTILPVLLHSNATTTLQLSSTNPFDDPVIVSHHLSEDIDYEILIDGIRLYTSIIDSPYMEALGVERLKIVHPKCKTYEYDSGEFWRCQIRKSILTITHATGACAMGAKGDPKAVVDQQLKVHGIDGLRVADASIMPDVPSGNTNLPCMMIGERAADMIKAYAKKT